MSKSTKERRPAGLAFAPGLLYLLRVFYKLFLKFLNSTVLMIKRFLLSHWKGFIVVLLATMIFFLPILPHLSSYSEGGDAMFNAWTLSRNHHCILQNDCPIYTDANIYFPHKDTMLYSETQLSAGLLTLPLHLLNNNPLFAYNIWTIVSFFFAGLFMYLLAKHLSRGNEIFSIAAGLIFEFAPFKMAAISHLQNLSIFYLPLIFLLILKYFESRGKRHLVLLWAVLVLQFYASWYQMVFVLAAVGLLLVCVSLLKLVNWKLAASVTFVVVLATMATLPLAKEYVRFSGESEAGFSINDQVKYSSSLADYFIPHNGTLFGKLYYGVNPTSQVNSFNPDSHSYHGLVLYTVGLVLLAYSFLRRDKNKAANINYKWVVTFVLIGLAGVIISLGPLLKLKDTYFYSLNSISIGVPLPYLLINELLPQLSFIRALGRGSVLTLFALCCLLAYMPRYIDISGLTSRKRRFGVVLIIVLIIIELAPIHLMPVYGNGYNYNLDIPQVYQYVKSQKDVNNLVILSADEDYPDTLIPFARAEQIMWSGYHNKNIFNGYSGYTPPEYFSELRDFVDFDKSDVDKLKSKNVRYVLVDKMLSTLDPKLSSKVGKFAAERVYSDERYDLYKL